jgi:tetratricopeptide (TPR) repeat protein
VVVSIVLGLILWRWDIIDSPPYWDAAMGLFVEANFLAETHFDYDRLWHREPRFTHGGAAVYISSVLPTLVALLMTLGNAPLVTIVAYRLFNFLCVGIILWFVYRLTRPYAGIGGALLTVLVVLTVPPFAAQVDLLGMDIPMTAVAMFGAWCVSRQRYIATAVISCIAVLFKVTAGVLAPATIGLLVGQIIARWRAPAATRRTLWLALGANVIALGLQLTLTSWVGSLEESRADPYHMDAVAGLSIFAELRVLCPDLVLLFLLAFLLSLTVATRRVWRRWKFLRPRGFFSRLEQALLALATLNPLWIWGWLVTVEMCGLLILVYTIPRYLILPLPLVAIIAGSLLFRRPSWRPIAATLATLLICFNLANAYGRFYPAIDIGGLAVQDIRNGAQLERSREYLIDHRANIAAVRYLVEHAPSATILAGNPFVHFLGLPRLGYVDQPFRGFALNSFTTPTFPSIQEIRRLPAPDPIAMHVDNRFVNVTLAKAPIPGDQDEILHQDDSPSPLTIFRPDPQPKLTPRQQQAHLILRLWPVDTLLAEAGNSMAAGNPAAALETLHWILWADSEHLPARGLAAEAALAAGDQATALAHWEVVLSRAQYDVPTRMNVAKLLVQQGRWPAAIEHVLLALQTQQPTATEIDARSQIASWLIELKQWDQAERCLTEAIAQTPDRPEPHYQLGYLAALRQDPKRAIASYQEALRLKPTWSSPANNLAWLLATHSDAAIRDPQAAVQWAELAVKAGGASPSSLDTLAAAYASAGRFPDAIRATEQGLAQARQESQPDMIRTLQSRLDLYRANRPYLEPSKQ